MTTVEQDKAEIKADMAAYHSITDLARLLKRFGLAQWFYPLPGTQQFFMVKHRPHAKTRRTKNT